MQKRRFRIGIGESGSFEAALFVVDLDEDPKTAGAELASRAEIAGPLQESKQTPLFLPDELEKLFGADGVRLTAGIRLNTPAQVIAPPGAQAMSTCCIPKEPDRASHCHRTPASV
jgi:hypothetical protein